MRFSLSSDHKNFYEKNGFIEFEKLLKPEAVIALQHEIDSTLCSRLKVTPIRLAELSSQVIVQSGFDLWRDNIEIRKTLFKVIFSEIAAELFRAKFLRAGFDQYLTTGAGSDAPFNQILSLNDLSCARPLLGALVICLSDTDLNRSTYPIPCQSGNGVFLSADKKIDWNELLEQRNLRLLVLTYASKKTFYSLEKNALHTHDWKKLGYVFGDLLNDHFHPVLYRS